MTVTETGLAAVRVVRGKVKGSSLALIAQVALHVRLADTFTGRLVTRVPFRARQRAVTRPEQSQVNVKGQTSKRKKLRCLGSDVYVALQLFCTNIRRGPNRYM